MMVNVYYLSTLASRDETWDASHGKLMPAKLYSLASVINWLPPCFAPDDWRTSLCETIYNRLQAVDAPIKNHNGYTIRSMCPGDYLVIEGELGVYVCDRIGFRHEPVGPS